MSTLLLRLAGPMQSWGTDSKFDVRRTQREPSKSGVIGLIAAALGIPRQDQEILHTLASLRFGIRVDREGTMIRDYHTAHPGKGSPYVTHRYYLSDAIFVAGLESKDEELLNKIGKALQAPAFPLYLGRRSCPPTGRVFLEVSPKPLEEPLRENAPDTSTRLVLDAKKGEQGGLIRDVPLSFDPTHRKYEFRRVVTYPLHPIAEHDPMTELGEEICT